MGALKTISYVKSSVSEVFISISSRLDSIYKNLRIKEIGEIFHSDPNIL